MLRDSCIGAGNGTAGACINLRCSVNLRSIIGHRRSCHLSATHRDKILRPDTLHEDEDHSFIKDDYLCSLCSITRRPYTRQQTHIHTETDILEGS